MTHTSEDLVAGAIGGVAGGVLLTAMFLALEKSSGVPSDVVELGRKTADRLGTPHRPSGKKPGMDEQAVSHGGHLALSALMGAGYKPFRRATGLPTVQAGLLFGAGFYPLLFGLIGPALGMTQTPRQEGSMLVGQRIFVHALFGAVTALVADLIMPRA